MELSVKEPSKRTQLNQISSKLNGRLKELVAAHVITTNKKLFFHPARDAKEIETAISESTNQIFPYLETLTTVIEPYYHYISPYYEQTLNNVLAAFEVGGYYVRVKNSLLDVSYGVGEFVAALYAHLIDINDDRRTSEESLLRKSFLLYAFSAIAYNGLIAMANKEHPEIGATIAKVSRNMLSIVSVVEQVPSFGEALESTAPLISALFSKEITEALEKGITDYTGAMIKTYLPYLEEKLSLLEYGYSTFHSFINTMPEKTTLKA